MRSKLFFMAFVVSCASAIHADDRLPIPSAAKQKDADGLIREVFGREIENARTPDERSALTEKLLDEASKPNTSVAGRYAIFKAALGVAPDANVAMSVIEKLAEQFEIDELNAKSYTIRQMSKSATTPSEYAALAESAIEVLDFYIEQDNFKAALLLVEIALEGATKSRNAQLIRNIRANKKSVDSLKGKYTKVQMALATLETDPVDATSNSIVGEYKCFVKGSWEDGLPLLALQVNNLGG